MRIYFITVLLIFFTIKPSIAQNVRHNKNKIQVTNVSAKKDPMLVLTLTALIEGLYNGSVMVPDTITVELHDPTFTCLVIESQKGVLNTSGMGTFNFAIAKNDYPYFIVVKHRNSIETWSASTQTFTSSELSYDFTTAASQAHGNNMFLKGSKWCIYNGDINQDGYVNLTDLIAVNNDSYDGVTGHVITDITGDQFTNLSDLIIVNNNAYALVCKDLPLEAPDEFCYESQPYHSVLIGTQYWLKENLNVGTWIDGSQNQTDHNNISKYCPDNNPDYCATYGGLYQWNQAMQFVTVNGAKGICPPGWHIPTLNDLNTLATTVSGDGNALKDTSQGVTNIDYTGKGTNTSGFSALLSGYNLVGEGYNYFSDLTLSGTFWSSTQLEDDANYAYNMSLNWYDNSIYYGAYVYFSKVNGYSVRCVKN